MSGIWSRAAVLFMHRMTEKGHTTFPESVSEEQVEELMERCVKENKDLIIDLVKDHPVAYKPGCLY